MIKEQAYKDIANMYGCAIGVANYTGTMAERKTDAAEINRLTLQAIDMGVYDILQRRLITGEWGKTRIVNRYKMIIKELRNDSTKRKKIHSRR